MRNRPIRWLPALLIGPWLLLEVFAPPPRSELTSRLVLTTFLLAAVGTAVVFTRMGVSLKRVWILGVAGILGIVGLVLFGIHSPLAFMISLLVVWGAIGSGFYLFWIHPREV